MRASILVTCGALIVGLVVAGCDVSQRDTVSETTSTTTSAPALSPREEAGDVLAEFNVSLPADAEQIRVVEPPLERFRAKGFVSFVAPRQQVIDQTCRGLTNVYPDVRPLLTDTEFAGQILTYAGVKVDRTQYGYCDQREGGRTVLVLVPRAEGATTHVVVFHEPSR